jgi:hypothetical protein
MNKMDFTMQRFDFKSMADLVTTGDHETVMQHFSCSKHFQPRWEFAAKELVRHFKNLIEKSGSPVMVLSEDKVLEKFFELIDRHVQPESINEVVCAAYLAGKLVTDAPFLSGSRGVKGAGPGNGAALFGMLASMLADKKGPFGS